MNRKSFFLKVWKNTTFKFTNANCWRMIGFYGCVVASALMAYVFVWMFFGAHMESTADIWGVRYLQFLCLVAGVAYAYLAVKNNLKAQLLDAVVAARLAYLNSQGSEEEKEVLWNKYVSLCNEAER